MPDETQPEPTKPEASTSASVSNPIVDDDVTPAIVTITPGVGGRVLKSATAGRKENTVYVNVLEDDKNFYYTRKGNKKWTNEVNDAMDETKTVKVTYDKSTYEQIESGGAKYYPATNVVKN